MLNVTDLNTLRDIVTGNDPVFYDSVRKSAGIYGISRAVVDGFGAPAGKTYYPDLEAAAEQGLHYDDFRFDMAATEAFISSMCASLKMTNSLLYRYAYAMTPYAGPAAVQTAYDSIVLPDSIPAVLLAQFADRLAYATNHDPYLIVLASLVRHRIIDNLG